MGGGDGEGQASVLAELQGLERRADGTGDGVRERERSRGGHQAADAGPAEQPPAIEGFRAAQQGCQRLRIGVVAFASTLGDPGVRRRRTLLRGVLPVRLRPQTQHSSQIDRA